MFNRLSHILRGYFASIAVLLVHVMGSKTYGINVEIPPSKGQEDIAVTGPTRIEGNETELYDFIGVVNEYLRFTITIVTFAAILYAGLRLLTSIGGKSDGLDSTLNVLQGAGVGILLSMFSYVIVRLVINLL